MTDKQRIYVNNELFLGRVEEQEAFRRALSSVIQPPAGEDLPYIILLYGGGGIGKTTLARRFLNIAEQEPPFEGTCQTLWIDWEKEQDKDAGLKVGREHITIETVLERIHANVLQTNDKWGRHLKSYQEIIKRRYEVEQEADKVLTSSGEQDELSRNLVGVSTSGLAKVIRLALPIGETGETITQAFLEAGVTVAASQAAVLRSQIEGRLKAKLDPKQYALYLNPHEQLSQALGEGLKKIAAGKPLLIFFDTYEVIDKVDFWMREVMKSAGPRLIWVVAGRQNLVKNRTGTDGYQRGYADEFPRRLLDYDVRQLALADLKAYFADKVPERPLTEEEAAVLSQVTRGIPLAIKTAAALWGNEIPLTDIVGDITASTPHKTIVNEMTRRYMLHVVDDSPDKFALYALALADGNPTILKAMLTLETTPNTFDLARRLTELRNRYQAVHLDDARLHDEPAAFLTAYLRDDVMRTNSQVLLMNEEAVKALQAEMKIMEQELPTLEERAEDGDWVQLALDLTRMLFWLDEQQAWQWLIPRFVESLAYSRELRQGLLNVAEAWKGKLTNRGKRRLKIFQAGTGYSSDVEAEADMLAELEKLARPSINWLVGEGEGERRAILDWQWGKLSYRQAKFNVALAYYKKSMKSLPEGGRELAENLAESLREIGWKFGGYYQLGLFDEAIDAYQQAIVLDPTYAAPYNGLGNVYYQLTRYDEAINTYQQAINLDPKYSNPHNGLGNVYVRQGHIDQAIDAYQQAISLDSKMAGYYSNLADVYRQLGRYDEAITTFQQAIALDPKYSNPHIGLGNVYGDLGRFDESITAYKQAIVLEPNYATTHNHLGNVFRKLGRFDEAIVAYEQAIALNPEYTIAHISLVASYRKMGLQRAYEELLPRARQLVSVEDEYNRACFEAIVGNASEALNLLEIALQKQQVLLDWARKDPDFDSIREDSRFQALVGDADG